jgi:hypothetical protein
VAFRFDKIKVSFVPYDGSPNPRNPFDHLSQGERVARIRRVLARVALRRMGDKPMLGVADSDAGLPEGVDDEETSSNAFETPVTSVGCTRKPSDAQLSTRYS